MTFKVTVYKHCQ